MIRTEEPNATVRQKLKIPVFPLRDFIDRDQLCHRAGFARAEET